MASLYRSIYDRAPARPEAETPQPRQRPTLSREQIERDALARNVEDADNAFSRGLRSTTGTFGSEVSGLLGLVQGATGLGDQDRARERLVQSQAMQETAEATRQAAGDTTQFTDVNGAGDFLNYVGGSLGTLAPDIATTVATAGAGGVAAGLARGGVRAGTRLFAREAAEEAAQTAARRATTEAAAEAAQTGVERAAARSAAARVTPTPAATPAPGAPLSTRIGRGAGATAGSATTMTSEFAGTALDTEGGGSFQDNSRAALAGLSVAAAIDTLPVMKLLDRYGGGSARRAIAEGAQRVAPRSAARRVASAATGQAAGEGSTEVAQTAVQLATHNWVNENISLFDDDARAQYLNAFMGGAIVGGVLAAPSGLRRDPNAAPAEVDPNRRGLIESALRRIRGDGSSGKAGVPMGPSRPDTANDPLDPTSTFEQRLRELELDELADISARAQPWSYKFDGGTLGITGGLEGNDYTNPTILAKARAAFPEEGIGDTYANFARSMMPEDRWQSVPADSVYALGRVLKGEFDDADLAMSRDAFDAMGAKQREGVIRQVLTFEKLREDGFVPEQLTRLSRANDDRADPDALSAPASGLRAEGDVVDMEGQDGNAGFELDRGQTDTGVLLEGGASRYSLQARGARPERGVVRGDRFFDLNSAVASVLSNMPKGGDSRERLVAAVRQVAAEAADAKNENARFSLDWLRDRDLAKNPLVLPSGERGKAQTVTPRLLADILGDSALANRPRPALQPGVAANARVPGTRVEAAEGDPTLRPVPADPRAQPYAPSAEPEQDAEAYRTVIVPRATETLRNVVAAQLRGEATAVDVRSAREALLRARDGLREAEDRVTGEAVGVDDGLVPDTQIATSGGTRGAGEFVVDRRVGDGEYRLSDAPAIDTATRDDRQAAEENFEGYRETLSKLRDTKAGLRTSGEDMLSVVRALTQTANGKLSPLAPAKWTDTGVPDEARAAARRALKRYDADIAKALLSPDARSWSEAVARDTANPDKSQRRVGRVAQARARAAEEGIAARRKDADVEAAPKVERGAVSPGRAATVRAIKKRNAKEKLGQRLSGVEKARAAARDQKAKLEADRELSQRAREAARAKRAAAVTDAIARRDAARAARKRPDTANDPLQAAAKAKDLDVTRDQAMVDMIAERFGLAAIKLVSTKQLDSRAQYAQAKDGQPAEIRVRPELRGSQRVEAILHEIGHHIEYTEFDGAPSGIQAAVRADFEAWLAARRPGETQGESRASRALPATAKLAREKQTGPTPDGELGFAEFFADSMARALAKNEASRSAVEKFYVGVARKLKKLYDVLRGVEGADDYNPPASFEGFLNHLAGRKSGGGPRLPDAPTDAPQISDAKPSSYAYLLRSEEQKILVDFFMQPSRERQLRAALGKDAGLLDNLDTSHEAALNAGIALYLRGELDLKPNVRNFVERIVEFMRQVLLFDKVMPTKPQLAAMILADVKSGSALGDKNYNARLKAARERGPAAVRVRKVVNATEAAVGPIYNALARSIDARVRGTGNQALAKIYSNVNQLSGERRSDGHTGLSAEVHRRTNEFLAQYGRAIESIDDMPPMEGKRADGSTFKRTKEASTRRRKAMLSQYMRDRKNEALSAKIDAAGLRTVADALDADLSAMYDYAKDRGMDMPKRENYWPVVMDEELLQRDPSRLTALLTRRDADGKPMFQADIKKLMDRLALDKEDFTTDGKFDMAKAAAILTDMASGVRKASRGPDYDRFSDSARNPAFAAANARVLSFLSNSADPEVRREFAKLQSNDLDSVMIRYVRALTRRAEYTARFGDKGEELRKLMNEALATGADPKDVALVGDLVDSAMGDYNNEFNPILKSLMDTVDGWTGNRLGWKDAKFEDFTRVQSAIATYQNFRLLMTSALASAIDPLGVIVRGGSFVDAVKSMRDAYKAMREQSGSEELLALARTMGVAERAALSDALLYSFGSSRDGSGFSARANDMLFKWNGLAAVTRFTRMTALANAHRFLLKHGELSSEQSLRYLKELDLAPADIKPSATNPDLVDATNPKVYNALLRFVEESVVRPTPTTRPLWHNDPNFMLASQYKGYLFAFSNTVLKRAAVELKHGNYAVLAPLAAYLPVTIAAELLRDMLQQDDEKREEWTAADWTALGLDRSGLLGARIGLLSDTNRDLGYGGSVVGSLAGPTAQQVGDLASAVVGTRSIGGVVGDAVPGWNNLVEGYFHTSNRTPGPVSGSAADREPVVQ